MLLSSVKLMAALGVKSEKPELKENRAETRELRGDGDVVAATGFDRATEAADRQKTNKVAAKKSVRMKILGVRILYQGHGEKSITI